MKKDENSGVSIKQILITSLFLAVVTLGGLNAYRIVCDKDVQTIQNLENANLEALNFETALVENTEDDVINSKNIKFLSAKIINESSNSSDAEVSVNMDELDDTNDSREDIDVIRNESNYSDKVISRGNFVREEIASNIESTVNSENNNSNKLLNTVVKEIKELSEKQEEIIENLNLEIETNDTSDSDAHEKEENIVENASSVAIIEENPKLETTQTETIQMETTQTETTQAIGVPTEYVKTIDVKATAYCLCKKCCGKSPSNPAYGITASGLKIIPGTGMKVVASDPSVIPLGTEVYIEGLYGAKDYGYAIVADTGSAIKNLKIDLYMDTHQMALNWGVKSVRVYILNK